jgi:hypothetical protein
MFQLIQTGVQLREAVPPVAANQIDVLVTAYMASSHGDPLLLEHIDDIQRRHSMRPEMRVAVAACGPAETEVTEGDVYALLCSDGQFARRRAARIVTSPTFQATSLEWLVLAARGKVIAGESLVATGYEYGPDVLIARNADQEGRGTWLGQY